MPASLSRLCVPGRKPEEASVFLSRGASAPCVRFTREQAVCHNVLRSKNRLLEGFLVKLLMDCVLFVLGADVVLILSAS